MPLPSWATLYHFGELESTNSWAAAQLSTLPNHAVVVANRQSGGRGRRGRSWSSELGGLYFTWVFAPRLPIDQQPHYGVVAAVALAEWLQKQGADVELKWPNDLLVNGAKLSGILLDAMGYGEGRRLLLGIGINLHNTITIDDRPTVSLAQLLPKSWEPLELLGQLLPVLQQSFALLEENGMVHFSDGLRRFNRLIGTRQRLRLGEEVAEGVVEGIDSQGALLFRLDNGEQRTVWSGELLL